MECSNDETLDNHGSGGVMVVITDPFSQQWQRPPGKNILHSPPKHNLTRVCHGGVRELLGAPAHTQSVPVHPVPAFRPQLA